MKLPRHVYFRNNRYNYTPPPDARRALVCKAFSTIDKDDAIARANAYNLLIDQWRASKKELRLFRDSAKAEALIADFLNSETLAALKPSTQEAYKYSLQSWKDIPVAGIALSKRRLDSFTVPMCQRFYDAQALDGKLSQLNLSLAVIRLLFNYAIRRGYITHNPWAYVKPRKPPKRKNVWEKDEVRAFLNTAFSEYRWRNVGLIVYCAYEWGQRPGDMRNLTWSQYDRERGVLTLEQAKRGEVVTLPASEGLRKMLDQQFEEFGWQSYIVPSPYRKSARPYKPYTQQAFNAVARQIQEAAGIDEALQIRDLRRTAITEMVEVGVPLSSIMSVSGHATMESLNPYVKKTLKAATNAQDMRGISEFVIEADLPERKRK